jgi:predicted tellurium resistance membrane protein TerC
MAELIQFEGLFTAANAYTLVMLVFLQAVLGFDNLLYISIESKRVAEADQARVRKIGILVAIALRIILLFVLMTAIKYFEKPFMSFDWPFISGDFNVDSFITLLGGAFIIYTATKEIYHMLSLDDLSHGTTSTPRSAGTAIFWIVMMNLVFSFDSILGAKALTDVFLVMATAIVIGGLLMLWLADHVVEFLKKNRIYEVLGLFILFIVGIMLVSEGGHKAHVEFFGHEVHAMTKPTFYFVLTVLVLVDVVQGRYQRKLVAMHAQAVKGDG